MKENTERQPSYVRKYISPHAVGHSDLDLDLYRQPLEALATLQGEVQDRIDHAQERLDYLTSKASASNLAIAEYQNQLGALNTARSNDDAEAQRLRDVLFDLGQDQQHVAAALKRAERQRQMEADGERDRIARLPWQGAYADICAATSDNLTDTLLLWCEVHGVNPATILWTTFVDFGVGLGVNGTDKKGAPIPWVPPATHARSAELLASLEKTRTLIQEARRLSLLATGHDSFYPVVDYHTRARSIHDAAHPGQRTGVWASGPSGEAGAQLRIKANNDPVEYQRLLDEHAADHAARLTSTEGNK